MPDPLAPLAPAGSSPAAPSQPDPPAPSPAPNPAPSQPSTPPAPAHEPAASSSSGDGDAKVPKSRLDQVLAEKKAADDELAQLRKFKEDADAAKLSEVEREQKQREKAERDAAEARRELRKTRVELAAQQAGALDAEAISALLSPESALGKSIDATKPETISKAVDELKEQKPSLFGEQPKPQARSFGTPLAAQPSKDGEDPKMGLGRDLLTMLRGGAS
jgi:NACalpha-BTF3-like transcription factor